MVESEEELQTLANTVDEEGKDYRMKMNVTNPRTMVVSRNRVTPKINTMLDVQKVEQVISFVYFGQLLTQDGKCEAEIKKKIVLARNAFSKMQKVLTLRKVSIETKKRLVKC